MIAARGAACGTLDEMVVAPNHSRWRALLVGSILGWACMQASACDDPSDHEVVLDPGCPQVAQAGDSCAAPPETLCDGDELICRDQVVHAECRCRDGAWACAIPPCAPQIPVPDAGSDADAAPGADASSRYPAE